MCFVAVCNGSTLHVSYNNLSRPYDTLDQAAIEAVQDSYARSNHYEFGGVLVFNKKTHKYYYQIPSTDLSIDSVSVNHDVKFTDPDLIVVSEFHTHTCFPYTHYPTGFSPNDVFNYMVLGEVGYMGNFCNGIVQKWDPTDLRFLEELDGAGPYGVDRQTVYWGDPVGKIRLNKTPDIQESILDIPFNLLEDIR